MIISPYRTKFTREHQAGEKNPERDMVNRKAIEKPLRKAMWENRKAKEQLKKAA